MADFGRQMDAAAFNWTLLVIDHPRRPSTASRAMESAQITCTVSGTYAKTLRFSLLAPFDIAASVDSPHVHVHHKSFRLVRAGFAPDSCIGWTESGGLPYEPIFTVWQPRRV
jgi:hypothetical protein